MVTQANKYYKCTDQENFSVLRSVMNKMLGIRTFVGELNNIGNDFADR